MKSNNKTKPGENRKVVIMDDRINYLYLTGGKVAYCSNHPLLFEILNLKSVSPSLGEHVKDKIQLRMQRSVLSGTSLAVLCWACYHNKITSIETWQSELKQFCAWKNNFKFQIDHADSNQLNCTIYNLSMMSGAANRKKFTLTAEVKEPAVLYSGRYGKEYRISVFWPNIKQTDGTVGVCLNLKCRNASDYIDCLKEIRDIGAGYGRPLYCPDKEFWKANSNSLTKLDVTESIRGQEALATITDCIPCKKGGVKKLYKEITGINLT